MTRKEIKSMTKEFEKKLFAEELEKQKYLSSKTDFSFLEALIQKCNENPSLRVEVFLNDGTKLFLKTYDHLSKKRDLINGRYVEDIVESYGR